MFLSNSLKLVIIICLPACFLSGCTPRPGGGNAGPLPTPLETAEFPFSVAEPDVFQAEVVVSGGGVERKVFVARDHAKYRIDYDTDSPERRAVIRGEKNYLVNYKERIYTGEGSGGGDVAGSDEPYAGLLLGQRLNANFEKLGTEDGMEKYEGRFENDDASPVVVYVEPAANMIVKEEIYRQTGDGRQLVFSTELRNLKLEAAGDLFRPPADFRRVTMEEFKKIARR